MKKPYPIVLAVFKNGEVIYKQPIYDILFPADERPASPEAESCRYDDVTIETDWTKKGAALVTIDAPPYYIALLVGWEG